MKVLGFFIKNKILKAFFMIFILIFAFFSVSSSINAESTLACCERTKDGEYCIYTLDENCDENYRIATFQKCEETSFCKLGCCISPNGECNPNVAEANCLSRAGYVFIEDSPNCDIDQCIKGCCVIGGAECAFVTEKKCEKIMEFFPNLEMDFRDVFSEIECTEICRASEKGCCVTLDGCEYTTRAMCPFQDINPTTGTGFYAGIYCSDPALNEERKGTGKVRCNCRPRFEKKCVEGEEDVFWFDSC